MNLLVLVIPCYDSNGLMVGPDDLKGIFQPLWLYDFMILWCTQPEPTASCFPPCHVSIVFCFHRENKQTNENTIVLLFLFASVSCHSAKLDVEALLFAAEACLCFFGTAFVSVYFRSCWPRFCFTTCSSPSIHVLHHKFLPVHFSQSVTEDTPYECAEHLAWLHFASTIFLYDNTLYLVGYHPGKTI